MPPVPAYPSAGPRYAHRHSGCEPASLDFQRFFRDHDSNNDGFLQKSELLAAAEKQGDYGGTLTEPITTENATSHWIAIGTTSCR